eukprot:4536073-Pleurochrysis_carterae.AAC.1
MAKRVFFPHFMCFRHGDAEQVIARIETQRSNAVGSRQSAAPYVCLRRATAPNELSLGEIATPERKRARLMIASLESDAP